MPDPAETRHGSAERRFDALYRDHHQEILAYCIRRLPASDAEDAAAEVFAVAWRRLDEVPISEEAVRWLYGVSQRVVSNQWRSRRRRRRLTGRLGGLGSPAPETPEIQVVRSEEQEMVTRALSRLRWTDQEILRLAMWERLPHSGIAELLDISEAAVGQRISRARKRLASEVERLDRGPRSQVPLPRKKAG